MPKNTAASTHRAVTIALLVLFLLYFAGTSLLSPPSAQSNPAVPVTRADTTSPGTVKAAPAGAFVDSIGVATHLHYTDSVYNKFDALIRPRLLELGVRHVADAAYTYPEANRNSFFYKRLRQLGLDGIKFNLGVSMDTRNGVRTDITKLDDVQAWTDGAVEVFEGVNEPDITGIADWALRSINLQRDLWQKVRSDPALRNVDVIAPSPVWKPQALGDISQWSDYGNWHAYPGGRCATCPDVYGQSFDKTINKYLAPTRDKPLMITETGYHNATVSGDHRPVSERAAGKYIPRLLFEYFNRGVARTYLYELIDLRKAPKNRDANFGLLRNDGSRKPAFVALRNLIELIEDPGPAFTADSLDIGLEGDTTKVHHTLLQKRDGTFYLALWQERPSYDTGERANRPDAVNERGDLKVPEQTVTIRTGRTFSAVTLYRPGASQTPQRVWKDTAQVTVAVPDEVVLLALRADGAVQPAPKQLGDPPPVNLPACTGNPPSPFRDVDENHPLIREIACVAALDIARGVGKGRRFEPDAPLSRWQMAVFLDRVVALGDRPRATSTPSGFRDISTLPREARRAVNRLHREQVISGTSERTFRPYQRVTRAQVAAFVHRLARPYESPGGRPVDYFTDDQGHPHEAAINALMAMGIAQDSGDRRFRPNAPADRGTMAAMLSRYLSVRQR